MPCTQKITAFPRSSRFSTYLSQRKTLTWIIAIESSPNMCLQTEAINSTDWRWHPATHTRAGRGWYLHEHDTDEGLILEHDQQALPVWKLDSGRVLDVLDEVRWLGCECQHERAERQECTEDDAGLGVAIP